MDKPSIKKISWKEARLKVKSVNPELFAIIEKLDPSPDYGLYDLHLPYGCECVKKGKAYLPDADGKMVSFDAPSLDNKLKDDLSYNVGSNPVSLVLKNTFEIFMEMSHYTIPFVLVPTGALFSTWVILDPVNNYQPPFLWDVCAGARSIFMLPRISVSPKFSRLKQEFNFESDLPVNLLEQGNIFKKIVNTSNFGENWNANLLYFGKKWFTHLHDEKWAQFSSFLHDCAWKGSGYWRNEFIWNLIFSMIQQLKHLRPNPYVADTVKHLLSMAIGAYPGFSPALDDQVAPIKRLQNIFRETYVLDEYPPIIMQPAYFSMKKESHPVYYSLQYPTTFCFSPRSRKRLNKIADLDDIRYILKKYMQVINSGKLNLAHTPLEKIAELVEYDFFHGNPDSHEHIVSSKKIFEEDPVFKKAFNNDLHLKFPYKSPFLMGCVRITKKK